jgi:hypothetical protein
MVPSVIVIKLLVMEIKELKKDLLVVTPESICRGSDRNSTFNKVPNEEFIFNKTKGLRNEETKVYSRCHRN